MDTYLHGGYKLVDREAGTVEVYELSRVYGESGWKFIAEVDNGLLPLYPSTVQIIIDRAKEIQVRMILDKRRGGK